MRNLRWPYERHGISRSHAILLIIAITVSVAVEARAEAFRFGWQDGFSAHVKAASRKKDTTSTASYRLVLEQLPEEGYALHFADFTFLTLNGVDAANPEIAKQLGPLASITSNLPTMHIGADGAFLGTYGLDAMRERLLDSMGDQLTGEMRAQLKRYFESPKLQAAMQQRSGELWNVWVGAWNGLDLSAGEEINASVPIAVLGEAIAQSVHVEHLGPASNLCATCVRLRMTTLIEGPQVVRLVRGLLAEASRSAADAVETDFESARSFGVTETVVEPATLIPWYARLRREVSLRGEDGTENGTVDEKEFWFSWEQP